LWALIKVVEVNPQGKAGQRRASEMKVVEASAVIPLSPEEVWDFAFGDQLQRFVEAVDNIIFVEDFQMRADGIPRYRMVRKVGPLTMSTISDYSVFERPYRTVSRALNPDAPFGGTFYTTSEPVAGGTRVSFRMEVEPQNALASVMLPVIRPLFARQLQQDLDDLVKAATPQQGDQQRQEEGVSRLRLGLSGGTFVLGAAILALYLLLRQRRGASRRWRY
jgi:Polyketide cyclase / dehydrase and lipid transport